MFFEQSEIIDLLKCENCSQQYDEYSPPRILPCCGKTLCYTCIQSIEKQLKKNKFKCIACNYETYSFEKFYDIPLLIESESFSGIILSDLLKEFFSTETFDWDTPCEKKRCRKKISHEKSLKLTILPEILVLCLQRYNNRTNKKNCSRIKILETIDMSDFIDRECAGIIKLNFYRIL